MITLSTRARLNDGFRSQDNRIKQNEHEIDDKHITITSGKNSEAKEIYEKIKKRLIADMINI